MAEPPPKAIMPSLLTFCKYFSPSIKLFSLGLESTSEKTSKFIPAPKSLSINLENNLEDTKVLSVTTKGLCIFNSSQHRLISTTRPQPNLISVGKDQLA